MPFEWAELKLQQFHMFVYYFYTEYFPKNSSKRWIISHRLIFELCCEKKNRKGQWSVNLSYFELIKYEIKYDSLERKVDDILNIEVLLFY